MTNGHEHDSNRHINEHDKLVLADDAVRDTSDILLANYGFNSAIGQALNTLIISNDTGGYIHLIQGVVDHFFGEHSLSMPGGGLPPPITGDEIDPGITGDGMLTIEEHEAVAVKLRDAFFLTEDAEVSLAIGDQHPTLKTETSLVQFNLSVLISELESQFAEEHPGEENPYRSDPRVEVIPSILTTSIIRSVVTGNISNTIFNNVTEGGGGVPPPPIAAVSVSMVEAPAITAGTVQSFTVAGFGTPKAAMFIVTNATVVGTPAADAKMSIGVTDGVRHRVSAMRARDNNTASDTMMHSSTDEVITMSHRSSDLIESEANFSQWVTDGVEINWGVLPTIAHRIVCILFGGDDLSAHVNEFTSSATIGGEVDVVDPEFEPDQVLIITRRGAFSDLVADEAQLSFGVCDNGASVVQGSINMQERHARATTTVRGIARNNRVAQDIDTSGDKVGDVELSTFDAQGFSVFTRLAGSITCGYLALAFGGGNHWAGNIASPTVGGSTPQVGVGFTPQFVLYIMSHSTVDDLVQLTGNGGAVGIGAFTPDDEFCATTTSHDGQVTTNTDSIVNNQAIDVPLDTGLGGHQAAFVSMDADGWTLNYSGVDGTPRLWAALAIG